MAAPARQAAAKLVDTSSTWYKFRRWMYYKSYFPQLGLRKDDVIMETYVTEKVLAEALKRIPKQELYARNYRILRANQLCMLKQILPRDQWTVYEEDTHYLLPYMEEVEKEFEERKQWDSA
ncbi:hypothetical protein BsWGS_14292 [Bradybaena similaris]